MSRLGRTVVPLVLAGLLAATAACSEEAPVAPSPTATKAGALATPTPGPTLPPVGVDCPTEAPEGRPLRLTNGAGHSVAAVELGSGPSAVVLAHSEYGSLCEWLPYAKQLLSRGFRVLAFDFVGSGSSTIPKQRTYVEDIRTAVVYLRQQGALRVVIMGAAMGATMSVTAAAAIIPPVDGVIALSPSTSLDGVNAEKAAPSLKSPALYVAAETDVDFAAAAKAIYGATPADLGSLVLVPGGQHGIRLLDAEVLATITVRTAVDQFLYLHDPPPVPTHD